MYSQLYGVTATASMHYQLIHTYIGPYIDQHRTRATPTASTADTTRARHTIATRSSAIRAALDSLAHCTPTRTRVISQLISRTTAF